MKAKDLRLKRALRTALLVLLLSAAGMGKMYAYDFSAVCETGQSLHYEITNATDFYVNTVREDRNLEVNFDGGSTIADPPTQTHWTYNADATYCMTLTGVLYLDGESMQNNPRSEYLEIGAFCGYECRGSCLATFNPAPFAQGYFYQMMLYSDVQSDETITFRIWDHEANAYLDVICTSNITFVADDGLGNLMFPYALTFTTNGGTTPTSFTISATTEPAEGGVVSGAGTYTVGDDCTLLASANFGYSFVNWTEDGQVISSDAEYTFMVTGDRNLIAKFSSNNAIVFVDDNVKAICIANWDTNGDGELSYAEAAAVTDLGQVFRENTEITSFEELQYFIGLTTISSYTFYNCSNLTGSLYIPNSVTTIGSSSFANCSGLTGSLTVPNSVTMIDRSAFTNCNFTSITIPSSVTNIGENPFAYCFALEQIVVASENMVYDSRNNCNAIIKTNTNELISGCMNSIIPNTVTTIGKAAFCGCSGFTGSLVIPNSVTMIGDRAFFNCSGFTGSLTIPNSVTTIGNNAFSYCSSFTGSLTIGSSVTSIGDNAFQYCTGFTGSLTIPESVTTIGNYAFYGCRGFTGSLTIGNSVTSIGYCAFSGCNDFSSIASLAETPPSLGYDAFSSYYYSDKLVYVPCGYEEAYASVSWGGFKDFIGLCGGMVTVVAYPEAGGEVTGGGMFEAGQTCIVTANANEGYFFSDWTLNGNRVSTESEYTFFVADDMTLIAHFLQDGIIDFADAYVKDICVTNWDTDGDGELSYSEAAFVRDLSNHFQYNSDITSFDELQYFIGLSSINSNAFRDCSGLTSIVLPNTVFTIDYAAFSGCMGIEGDLIIPNSVTSIGQEAFYNCSGFTGNLTIGNSVTSIGYRAFSGCSGFTSGLIIPNSVTSIEQEAFCNCSGFTGNLTIGNSVTSIGYRAFSGCSGFTGSLVIPNSVSSIGQEAFYLCRGFSGSLIISNSVTSIGNSTFSGCNGFTGGLIIPNSVISIGGSAFYNCSGFTGNLIIPNSVTAIGGSAFYNCSGLTGDLVIPNSVTTIGYSAFENCSGFTGGLIIPNSVISIGGSAFYNCSGFTGNLIIPNSVTAIGGSAFYNCSGLTGDLVIPNSVTTIGYSAFRGCSGFTGNLIIGSSVTSIGMSAFLGCNGFTSIMSLAEIPPTLDIYNPFDLWNSNTPVYMPCGFEEAYSSISWGGFIDFIGLCGGIVTVIAAPEEYGMVTGGGQIEANQLSTVTAIANEGFVFSHWTFNGMVVSLETEYTFYVAGDMTLMAHFVQDGNIVFADDNVKSICVANWDANEDEELSYVEAAAVTDLGQVFSWNTEITSFEELQYFIGLTTISSYAFYHCSNLSGSLYIPNSVTSIGNSAFADCSGFTGSLTIPNSVTSLGAGAFAKCIGFTGSLTIPNSVTSIGDDAFYYCSGFTGSLTIPESVTSIGNWAFAGCSGFIGSLTIPNSVTTIGIHAFSGCTDFTGSLIIPNSVVAIGDNPFSYCSRIEHIIVDINNPFFDSRENCNAIIETNTNTLISGCKNSVIFNGVAIIGVSAFAGCWGLSGSLTIPNSVTTIGSSAFDGCSGLTGCLTIPNSVTTIGISAFRDCYRLKEIIMLGATPPSLDDNYLYTFSNTKNCPIYVPYESLNDYKTATNWSNYQHRIFPMAYTTVAGYGEGEGNYRFIASPLVENTAPTAVDNMITETAYDLYRFDQSEDAEWQNYKFLENTPNFFLTNGQGYLYANAEDVNVIFKGEFNEDETKEVELAYDADADFAGWNLVGNPFPVSAYANRSYYTMNEDGRAVEPNAVSSATAIPACTGVMVKADDQGETVVFNTTAPETVSNQGGLRIALSQVVDRGGVSTGSTTLQDKAIVSFNAGDRLEKFVFNKDNARISIPQDGKDLAIACAEKQGEMPLNFKATKNGTYTLSVDVENADVDYLHLIDNLTGADIDLLALRQAQGPAEYTFTAKITDYASRFRLVFSVCGDADGDNGTFAFINNGNIIVTGAEADAVLQIVDVTGRIIVCRDAARHVSTSGMTPGVYVLRLINGDNVKMQKIVIDR